ncbi:MAG: hypothetical protein ACOC32_03300 [Nanoarchaeota archaeon]
MKTSSPEYPEQIGKIPGMIKNIPDHIAAHPIASGIAAGIGVTAFYQFPPFQEAQQAGMSIEYLTERWPYIALSIANGSIIGYLTLSPFSKMAEPKFSNWKKAKKLEWNVLNEYEVLEKEKRLEETYEDLTSCFGDNKNLLHKVIAGAEFKQGNIIQGLQEYLTALRLEPHQQDGFDFPPLRILTSLLTDGIYDTKAFLKDHLSQRSPEEKKTDAYRRICQTLHKGAGKRTRRLLKEIEQAGMTTTDALAKGLILSFSGSPDREIWEPFFEKLDEELASTGQTLDGILEKGSDSRNAVYRHHGLFLKEYRSKKAQDAELSNISHFKSLGHVIKGVVGVTRDSIPYAAIPFSGESLYEHFNGCSTDEKEDLLERSLDQLVDIQLKGEALSYDPMTRDEYTQRAQQSISEGLSDTFFALYDDLVSAKIAAMETTYYKDHNLRNILLDEGILREIDFEHTIERPHAFDVISCLEGERTYLDDDAAERLAGAYIDSLEKKSGERIDREEFLHGLEYCRVQRHIELYGYRSRDYDENGEPRHLAYSRYNLMAAKEALEQLYRDEKEEGFLELAQALENYG